jgi:hypothetical protein
MSTERKGTVTQIVREGEEWVKILSRQTGVSPENAPRVLSVWTLISDVDWGDRWEDVHIYVNESGLQRYGFPEGSTSCKAIHEETEAQLRRIGLSRREAHLRAIEAEFSEARNFGILRDYAVAEVKSSLKEGFIRDALDKTFAYFRIKGQD